jgi:hypothetical protein
MGVGLMSLRYQPASSFTGGAGADNFRRARTAGFETSHGLEGRVPFFSKELF